MHKLFPRIAVGFAVPVTVAVAFLGCPGQDPFYLEGSGGQVPDGGATSGGHGGDGGGGSGSGGFFPMSSTAPASSGTGCVTCNAGGPCTDLSSDPDNCGSCGYACSNAGVSVRECTASQCKPTCKKGFTDLGPPPGGMPDDGCEAQLRTVFVTADPVSPTFGTANGADTICQEAAMSAFQGRTFLAWVSDDATSPLDRFTDLSPAPYVLADGVTQVTFDWLTLTTQPLLHAISQDQNGMPVPAGTVAWTGTKRDGTPEPNPSCADWTDASTASTATIGDVHANDAKWSESSTSAPCGLDARIYCFEQIN